MKRKIYLDGELGEKFGKVLTLDVNTFVDVFRAIECQRPEMRQYLVDCHENDIGFIMHIEDRALTTEEEILMKFGEGDMYISPAPQGSGGKVGNIFKTIIGAVFVIAGILVAPFNPAFGAALFTFGMGLMTNGLANLLAPDPSTDNEDVRQDSSYLFQGSGQTILEGDPVPLLYGRLRIPGRLIDFDVRNTNSYYSEPGFGGSGAGNDIEAPDPGNDPPGGPRETPPNPLPVQPEMPTIPGQTERINFGGSTTPNIIFNPSSQIY